MTNSDTSIRSICLYCGSSPGENPNYIRAASALGKALADSNIRLVYGGGDRGLMGAAAIGCIEAGGKVTGIIPDFLMQMEQSEGSEKLSGVEMSIVPDMHTRKQQMFEQADAFIALPGGIGTLEELIEIMTWAQLGRHEKPMGLLNVDDFWSPLITLLDHMGTQGFIHTPERTHLRIATRAEDMLAVLKA